MKFPQIFFLIFLVAVVSAGAYFIFKNGVENVVGEKYCVVDSDCACGVKIGTGECFYGNKIYVDTDQQCPDFCTGIAAHLSIKCMENECKQVLSDPTFGWQTYSDSQNRFSFKYPAEFNAITWNAVNWPPKVTVVNFEEDPIKAGCPDYESDLAIGNNNLKINDIDFTLYVSRGAAAGSSYTDYCYIAERNQKYYVLEFLIRTTNGCGEGCGPYCQTQYENDCRNFNLVFDVEAPISQIMSTFEFLR